MSSKLINQKELFKMACYDEVLLTSELNKLKKPDLVHLIIHKKLPANLVSDVISKFMQANSEKDINGPDSGFSEVDATDRSLPASGGNNCENPSCIRAKCSAEFGAREIQSRDDLVYHLKKRISDLESIIDLLKSTNSRKTMHNMPSSDESVVRQSRSVVPSSLIKETDKRSVAEVVRRTTTNLGQDKHDTEQSSNRQSDNVNKSRLITSEVRVASGDNLKGALSKNVKKRMQDIIYGSKCDASEIKGIPRVGYLHVSRLDPKTTADSVSNYLDQITPGCSCEMLNSKFPNIYSSFKVTVSLEDISKIMNPLVWPTGVRINRFFHRRVAPQTGV